ncbi:anti-sigma factor antagonist [Nocardia sp. NPDC050435]|uniref:anti-sigma factor antagonist n=1 Tax=Nocardia sp. NPDC050435 TaxID=3155040 RepID=UPI0033DC9601
MTNNNAGPKTERDLRPAGTRLSLESTVLDGVTVLRIGGEIDVLTAPHLGAALDAALAADAANHGVAVDLQAVTFLASAGLSVLAAQVRQDPRESRIAVVADNSATLRPMQLTGLIDLLIVRPTLAEACAQLRANRNESA